MKIGSLVVEFLSETSGYSKGANEVNKSLDDIDAKTKTVSASSKTASKDLLMLGAAATAAGYAVYASVQKYGALAAELKDLSLQTGATTDEIQRLQYTALLSSTPFSQVSSGINKLALSMAEAKDETSAQAKAFAQLGVSPEGKTPAEVFDEVAYALYSVRDETTKAQLANTLYGNSWKELVPYIETYVQKRDEIRKAPVISQKEINDLEDAKVRWDELTNSLTIYSGKALAFIYEVQNRRNRLNPIAWLLGFNDTKSMSGVDYNGKTISGPTESADPFAALTLRDAEIKYLTDYTIPGLQKKLDELKKSGTAQEIADASLALIQAKENLADLMSEKSDTEKERISSLTTAYKEYQSAIEKTRDAAQSLADLQAETGADLQDAGTDVSEVRRIVRAYSRDRESLTRRYAATVYDTESAAGVFNTIAGGADPSTVPGTSQYTEAQAQKMSAGGITITGDIYLNGDKSFENYLSDLRISMGVPNR